MHGFVAFAFFVAAFGFCLGAGPSFAYDAADALVSVAENGDLEKVRFLIESKKVGVDARSSMGVTPLWAAAKSGQLSVVKFLLDNRASLNIRCWDGQTPLIAAASTGQTDIVKLLIRSGADEDVKDGNGWTAKKWADVQGHRDTFRFLDSSDAFRLLHLHFIIAIDEGRFGDVQRALARGIDANEQGPRKQYMSPLSIAARKGHLKIAQFLIDKGSDPNAVNGNGATPLYEAVRHGRSKMVQLLLDNGATAIEPKGAKSALEVAGQKNDSDLMALLERKRNDERLVKEKNDEYLEIVRELAPYRCKKFGELSAGDRDLAASLYCKMVDALDEIMSRIPPRTRKAHMLFGLLEETTDPNSPGGRCDPFTPLMNAAAFGNLQRAQKLISEGVDVNERNGIGETPILIGLSRKVRFLEGDNFKVISLLVDRGADLTLTDPAGRTPLMMAAANGDLFVVKLLITKGAAFDTIDSSGTTALAMAQKHGHKTVVEALQNAASTKRPASAQSRRAAPNHDED